MTSQLAIFEARRDRALREISTLGVFAPAWAWFDRNHYEAAAAHETRRLERKAARSSWLRSWFGGFGVVGVSRG